LLQWWEGELERAYVLQEARCIHELQTIIAKPSKDSQPQHQQAEEGNEEAPGDTPNGPAMQSADSPLANPEAASDSNRHKADVNVAAGSEVEESEVDSEREPLLAQFESTGGLASPEALGGAGANDGQGQRAVVAPIKPQGHMPSLVVFALQVFQPRVAAALPLPELELVSLQKGGKYIRVCRRWVGSVIGGLRRRRFSPKKAKAAQGEAVQRPASSGWGRKAESSLMLNDEAERVVGEEEREAVLAFVVQDLPQELFVELMRGVRHRTSQECWQALLSPLQGPIGATGGPYVGDLDSEGEEDEDMPLLDDGEAAYGMEEGKEGWCGCVGDVGRVLTAVAMVTMIVLAQHIHLIVRLDPYP
jgi:hypothetical protein